MPLTIITADERLAQANAKTTMAIFGPSGVGKTSLLRTLPPETTLCIDLEAGMKSVQDWPGDSIPIRAWPDAVDIACLIGGVDPAADPSAFFSEGHYRHVAEAYPDLVRLIAEKRIIFATASPTSRASAWRGRRLVRNPSARRPASPMSAAPTGCSPARSSRSSSTSSTPSARR